MNDPVVMMLPALVKSHMDSGRRIAEVEASTEEVDFDGDVILQKALLDSAASFIKSGHLDLDHISEFGYRLGIKDPASFVVGRPLEVKDIGGNRTSVIGHIKKSTDGTVDPRVNRYDDFWQSLQTDPPTIWYASVYGFPLPGGVEDCTNGSCSRLGVKRWLVKSFDWRSLAFTRTPKNTAIKGAAKIISAKSWMAAFAKGLDPYSYIPPMIQNINDLEQHKSCPSCRADIYPSVEGYKQHFVKCCGLLPGESDIYAHAMMHHRNRVAVLNSTRL